MSQPMQELRHFWLRTCKRKKKRSAEAAHGRVRQLKNSKKTKQAAAKGKTLRAYKCLFCGWWHVGNYDPKHETKLERAKQLLAEGYWSDEFWR